MFLFQSECLPPPPDDSTISDSTEGKTKNKIRGPSSLQKIKRTNGVISWSENLEEKEYWGTGTE